MGGGGDVWHECRSNDFTKVKNQGHSIQMNFDPQRNGIQSMGDFEFDLFTVSNIERASEKFLVFSNNFGPVLWTKSGYRCSME